MVKQITEGISIAVETFYQEEQSNPLSSEYVFAYRVTIENLSPYPIKVHSRYWLIIDSNGMQREVTGEGVVGRQPIIEPGSSYQYVSGTSMKTDMGKMYGYYTVENLALKTKLDVAIPEFDLIAPFKNN